MRRLKKSPVLRLSQANASMSRRRFSVNEWTGPRSRRASVRYSASRYMEISRGSAGVRCFRGPGADNSHQVLRFDLSLRLDTAGNMVDARVLLTEVALQLVSS